MAPQRRLGQVALFKNTHKCSVPANLAMDGMNLLKQKGKVGMICILGVFGSLVTPKIYVPLNV